MTIAADVLRDMIIQTEQQEEEMNKSISNIDDQIADLQKKQNGMRDGYCTPIMRELNAYLESLYPPPNYLACGTILYNDSTNQYGTGNLTDFYVLQKKISNSEWTMLSSSRIRLTGDRRSTFSGYSLCAFGTVSGSTLSNQSMGSSFSVSYDASSNYTYVQCSYGIIQSSHNWMYFGIVRSYNNPSDSNVNGYVDRWEYGHDYICKEISTTGTYGTKDMMAKLNTSKSLLNSNKTKIVNSRTKFEPYATPE